MKKLVSMLISISMIFTMLPTFVIAEGEKSFELSKTELTKGEKVVITNITGTENQDWFGVYRADVQTLDWDNMVNGIYKYHNSKEGDGTIVLETAELDVGDYLVILLENNGYTELGRKAFSIVEKAEVPALITYNSNANFSTSAGDGTWDGGVWRAEYWHPDWWSYVKMTDVHQSGTEYTDNAWDWSGEAIRVSGENIITTNTSNTKTGIRAFIAPYKGTVTIKNSNIINQSGNGIYVRITKTNSENQELKSLWADGWNGNANASYTPIYGWNSVTQADVTDVMVEKGDVIRFEAVSMDTGNDGKANWVNTISYTYIEPETTPEIAIDYAYEKLTGFGEGSYTIDGAAVTPTGGSLAIADYMGKTLSIVKKGAITATDSAAQSLAVPVRPAAPTADDITVTHPETIGGTGSISGMTGMEYKLLADETWIACTENEVKNLAAATYDIRKKATETAFKSAAYQVTINAFVPTQEATPEIAIDYENEKLTGFAVGGSYEIGGTAAALTDGALAIESTWLGTTVSIVKKGNGTTTTDSDAQSLEIPVRPAAPEVTAVDETGVGANDGKITGVTDTMEYKLSSEEVWTSVGSGLTEVVSLAPGSYNVRYKATASSFVSLSKTIAINARGVQEPIVTVPTLADVTYIDGMKLLNISLADISIPSGNTPGSFSWKTPNAAVNAGDNQKFDAVFTPLDINSFRIKDLLIPVNIKPAAITDIDVAGYEGSEDGAAHGVTITGTRAGDTVTYKLDAGEFTADAPSYTAVCEHTVTVKVSRANYTDFIKEVKIKITVAPLIYISNKNFSTTAADGTWDGGIWSAKCYVQDWWIYSDLTNVADNKYNLSWLENGLAKVDGSTLETDTTTQNFTARAFTAPQEGILRIEKTTITNKSAAAAKVQIRHRSTGGDLKHIWGSGATEIAGNGTTEQEAIELQISQGDIIYFEAASANAGTSTSVEWINTLKYIDEFTPDPTPTPTPKPTPAPPLEEGTYKSSHNFIPEDGSGVWENVWSAEIYHSADKTYTDAKAEYSGGYAENSTDEKQPVVYGNRMKVTGGENQDRHPVRKFIVPKDGKLRILETEITQKTWSEIQYNIKLNDKVIWTSNWVDSIKLVQPEQRLKDVKAGDIIRFEVILKESTSYGYEQMWTNTIVDWDGTEPTPPPVPTPTPNPDLNKKVYRASDSWSMEKNGDDAWKWQSYKAASKKYEDLPSKMEGNLMMGDWNVETGEYPDGSVWIAGEDWRWVAVGKYTMRATVDPGDPTTEETSGDFKVHRDYSVRTFISPKNGTVSIQAPNDTIWAKNDVNGTHIRIMCQRADGSKPIQVFPTEDWINIKGAYHFEPIALELGAGDKLMFENAFIWKQGGNSPWDSYVMWDPIVEYKTITPRLVRATPADGAKDVPLNAEHILTYDDRLEDVLGERVTVYEISADGTKTKSSAQCASISVEGTAVRFVLTGLKPYTSYAVEVVGVCYKGMSAENEKTETITFTTGTAVNIGETRFANGKVSTEINNPYGETAAATLIAAVCKGTQSQYSVEKTYYVTRRDIGANDVIETEVELPAGANYFIKTVVMEDMKKARAYGSVRIVKGGN